MSLVEQLGGYEKAKEVVLGNPETSTHYNLNSLGGHYAKEGVLKLNHRWQWFNTIDKNWYWDFSESNHIEIHDIEKALLEYRRQHNIYEVGDKVVYKPSMVQGVIFTVIGFDDFGWMKTEAFFEGFDHPKRFSEDPPFSDIRHATDEEIAAGRIL